MKIQVACEESQVVCKAFRGRGHEAYSCDIEPCSGGRPEWHIQGDALPLQDGNCSFRTQSGKWHMVAGEWNMIIAFPPCTYLSNAGARHLYPGGVLNQERYLKGMEGRAFFMRIWNAKCQRVVVENPVSSRVFEMPEHSQEIQPWMFGVPYTKKTRLWIRGVPPLEPTKVVEPVGPYVPAGTGRKDRSKYGAAKRGEDAKNRAKTFPEVGLAMAEQWGGFDDLGCM